MRDRWDDEDVGLTSVFEPAAERDQRADADERELAFLPSERAHRGAPEVTVELRRTKDGRLAVLAYDSLQALVSGCGERQPWVSLPAASVDAVVERSGADIVLAQRRRQGC